MAKQLTDGYFDEVAAGMIEKAFTDNGAKILHRQPGGQARAFAEGATLTLENGTTWKPTCCWSPPASSRTWLPGRQRVATRPRHPGQRHHADQRRQRLVGRRLRAGQGLFTDAKVMNAILPDATEQGRIAGMAMAGDPGLKPYPGGVPLNTYHFFGRHAISVGSSKVPEGGEMVTRFDEASGRYLKAIFSADKRLTASTASMNSSTAA
jgi:phenylglyoxylate dehydrogenase epsilon subunit